MEAIIWREILQHWPSILTGLVVAISYVRAKAFLGSTDRRIQILEERVRRLMNVCSHIHAEHARILYDEIKIE